MEIISLNTLWKFKPDPENTGLEKSWFLDAQVIKDTGSNMSVPSCWEEDFEDYEGVGWYALEMDIPEAVAGQAARLQFSAVNYRAQVWVNGQFAGEHEGGYTPFSLRVEALLLPGETNLVVVRVISPMFLKQMSVDDLSTNDMPHWRGGLTAGIWQSVHLEFNKRAFIDDTFYKPDLENPGFAFDLAIEPAITGKQLLSIEVCLEDSEGVEVVAHHSVATINDRTCTVQGRLNLENPLLWECDAPHLYTATARLLHGEEVISETRQKVGLRRFTFENERFFLNGKPIYPQGGFWEGVYAKHQSYPEDREVVRKEIRMAKAAGFNMLRPWRRPVPPVILEEADAAGLLIIASPAIECMSVWPNLVPKTPERIEHEIRQLILRDRNHACIIWWEMFNEVTREGIKELITPMSEMARSLDSTRLVLDESGGWATGAHFYLPGSKEIKPVCELHSYVRAPVSDTHWLLYQHLGAKEEEVGGTKIMPGQAIFVSEFGYGGWPEFKVCSALFAEKGNPALPAYRQCHRLAESLSKAITACGLGDVYPEIDDLALATQKLQARGNRKQLEALLSNPRLSGYCIHAFTDGDWIIGAGLIDNWQRPKEVYHAVAEGNQLPRLFVFPEKRNLRPGESLACRLVVRGMEEKPGAVICSQVAVGSESMDLVWEKEGYIWQCCTMVPASLFTEGANTLSFEVANENGPAVSAGAAELFVLKQAPIRLSSALAIYDPENDLAPWLEEMELNALSLQEGIDLDEPVTFLIVPHDVADEADLPLIKAMLDKVADGRASGIFLEPPSQHDALWALKQYGGVRFDPDGKNCLLESGTFPWNLKVRPSFAMWEASAHVLREHPIFAGLPQDCLMDEPYHEVAPVETFCELSPVEAPVQTITWFTPEKEDKAKRRTYLGGDEIWHGVDLATLPHGHGHVIISSLLLRNKLGSDIVARHILGNLVSHASTLLTDAASLEFVYSTDTAISR
jgi:beta-galactosidase